MTGRHVSRGHTLLVAPLEAASAALRTRQIVDTDGTSSWCWARWNWIVTTPASKPCSVSCLRNLDDRFYSLRDARLTIKQAEEHDTGGYILAQSKGGFRAMQYSVQYVPQSREDLCWAASTAMMVNYKTGSSKKDT